MSFDISLWPITVNNQLKSFVAISSYDKLSQRFLMELLTPEGSDIYRPTRGTTFLARLSSGISNEFALTSAFMTAEMQARDNLQLEEDDSFPPEERYVKTSIDRIIIDQNVVRLKLLTTSRTGLTITTELPIAV